MSGKRIVNIRLPIHWHNFALTMSEASRPTAI
jgi:hypothetical protein